MIFSIIIPVYNVERYLRQCLDSCLEQDIPRSEYEIIIVNDGSPDNSQSIIDEYAAKYDNIKVIIKENGGLSSARNAGLKVAKGDYIWFVDSDDSISANCLGFIKQVFADNPRIDLMTFGHNFLDENNNRLKTKQRNLMNGNIYNGLTLYKLGWCYPYSGVQFYVFDRCYLENNKLSFKDGIFGEDWLFTITSYLKIDACYFSEKKLYNYYKHATSITNSGYSLKKGCDCITICEELSKLLGCSKNKDYILYSSISQLIKSVYEHWLFVPNQDSKLIRRKFLENRFWLKAIRKSLKYKYLPLFLLLKLNIKFKI